MNKINIYCDGGFGNRLGCLLGGLLLAQENNLEIEISWPLNNWCGCMFKDIFKPIYKINETSITELFTYNMLLADTIFVIHENQTKLSLPNIINPNTNVKIPLVSNIVYYNNSIPTKYSHEQILKLLKELEFNENIIKKVKEFIINNNIDSNVLGIHFRKTDFGNVWSENNIFSSIQQKPEIKFFICSDSKETEEKFLKLPNVIVFPKKTYVEKLNPNLSWTGLIEDEEKRRWPFNVNRSRESVIEGVIDMLILSKTKIICDSPSSFLKFAKFYNKIQF